MLFSKPDLEVVWKEANEKVRKIVEKDRFSNLNDYIGYINSFTTFDSDNMLIVNAALWTLNWEELAVINYEQQVYLYNIQDLQDAYNNFAWVVWEYLFRKHVSEVMGHVED